MLSLLEKAKELLRQAKRGEAPDEMAPLAQAFVDMAELLHREPVLYGPAYAKKRAALLARLNKKE